MISAGLGHTNRIPASTRMHTSSKPAYPRAVVYKALFDSYPPWQGVLGEILAHFSLRTQKPAEPGIDTTANVRGTQSTTTRCQTALLLTISQKNIPINNMVCVKTLSSAAGGTWTWILFMCRKLAINALPL